LTIYEKIINDFATKNVRKIIFNFIILLTALKATRTSMSRISKHDCCFFFSLYLLFILKNNFQKLSSEAFRNTKNIVRMLYLKRLTYLWGLKEQPSQKIGGFIFA